MAFSNWTLPKTMRRTTPLAGVPRRVQHWLGIDAGQLALLALVTVTVSVLAGLGPVVIDGGLVQNDSYTRINRLLASVEAGKLLHHVPRDNGGIPVALHWSHLLDWAIVVMAFPLVELVGQPEALRLAGAAIGPLSLIAAVLAVLVAVRAATGPLRQPVLVGIVALSGPALTVYGMFGQATHHVLLGALAVLSPALALAGREAGDRRGFAVAAGATGAIGMWLSPEILPFVLFGWAIAILGDVEQTRCMGRSAQGFAVAFLAVIGAALLIDPPEGGWLDASPDRLSRLHLFLGIWMLATAELSRRFGLRYTRWSGLVPATLTAAAATGLLLAMTPGYLDRPEMLFSAVARPGFWPQIDEMKPPSGLRSVLAFAALPSLVLIGGCIALLWRERTPLAVLVVLFAGFVLVLAWQHFRFTVYLHLAAAITAGIAIERAAELIGGGWRQWVTMGAAAIFVTAPTLVLAAVPLPHGAPGGGAQLGCSVPRAAGALAPYADRIVLSSTDHAPVLIYMTRVVVVAGPYHRSEQHIVTATRALGERSFTSAMPPSFAATGAKAVLVCPDDGYAEGTLGWTLVQGTAPAWLVERPVDPRANFRLFEVR